MDYKKMILAGYLDDNTRKHLLKYFLREFNKAEREFYDPEEFFDGCVEALKSFRAEIRLKFNKRKEELETMLFNAEKGIENFSEKAYPNLTKEQMHNSSKEWCINELEHINIQNYHLNLETYSADLSGFLFWKDIEMIENTMQKASLQIIGRAVSSNNIFDWIIESFEKIHNKGWKYAFRNENDLIYYSNLLTKFFKNEPYTLPKDIIELKKGCQTRMASTLKEIHKEFSQKSLISDDAFFDLVKILNIFQKDSDIYKTISR